MHIFCLLPDYCCWVSNCYCPCYYFGNSPCVGILFKIVLVLAGKTIRLQHCSIFLVLLCLILDQIIDSLSFFQSFSISCLLPDYCCWVCNCYCPCLTILVSIVLVLVFCLKLSLFLLEKLSALQNRYSKWKRQRTRSNLDVQNRYNK